MNFYIRYKKCYIIVLFFCSYLVGMNSDDKHNGFLNNLVIKVDSSKWTCIVQTQDITPYYPGVVFTDYFVRMVPLVIQPLGADPIKYTIPYPLLMKDSWKVRSKFNEHGQIVYSDMPTNYKYPDINKLRTTVIDKINKEDICIISQRNNMRNMVQRYEKLSNRYKELSEKYTIVSDEKSALENMFGAEKSKLADLSKKILEQEKTIRFLNPALFASYCLNISLYNELLVNEDLRNLSVEGRLLDIIKAAEQDLDNSVNAVKSDTDKNLNQWKNMAFCFLATTVGSVLGILGYCSTHDFS